MKKRLFAMISLALVFGMMLTGCGKPEGSPAVSPQEDLSNSDASAGTDALENSGSQGTGEEPAQTAELTAQFGYEGKTFVLHLYDNDTAAAIAKHVGTSDWNLPIYHYDDFENCEVMQYYDIPSRYEIPSAPDEITQEKAGEVYYSDPNRIILFYHDAEVSAEYTPVGYFDADDEFIKAVENNPVLEGWGNKIITISASE